MTNLKRQIPAALILVAFANAAPAQAEILAALNYESKAGAANRREGVAVVDIDPASKTFNTIIREAPLPADFVAHHIYYNRDASKAYVTSLGRSALYVAPIASFPEGGAMVPVPDCKVGEDMVFSADKKRWFLSCMGSSNIIIGDAATDTTVDVIAAPETKDATRPFIKYPHGLTLNDGLDRLLVTSTVNPAKLKDAGESLSIIEASTGTLLSTHRLSNKPSPSGAAPVESSFVPKRTPQTAFVTNMFAGTLWTATWRPQTKAFEFKEVYDFASIGQGVPLEMEFSESGDRLYVTTAKPGALNIFDVADPYQPKLIATTPTAAGAHHFVFSSDRRYAFVQNSLLNLPDMSDGSVSVVDLETNKVIAEIDVLKKAGLNPNCIILLPKWRRNSD